MTIQTQKLIRCHVLNKNKKESIRYIEFGSFRLWQHLMHSKHENIVDDPTLCLWLSAEEYKEKENVFSHSGKVEPVDNIAVTLFDNEYGFTNTINRYVPNHEVEQLSTILASHIPPEIHDSDSCDITTYKGYSIQQNKSSTERALFLGLNIS